MMGGLVLPPCRGIQAHRAGWENNSGPAVKKVVGESQVSPTCGLPASKASIQTGLAVRLS